MIEIYYSKRKGNKCLTLPENFNELSGKQLIAIAGIKSSGSNAVVARLKVLRILLNMPFVRFVFLSSQAKAGMFPFVEWVFEKNDLTAQVLPQYKGFYGPKSLFDNITLGEFHFSELYYSGLVNGETEEERMEAMDKLVAVLYRLPKKEYNTRLDTDGDIRMKFNANELEYYSTIIKRWPFKVKLAIVFFYDGNRQHMVKLYDKVFQGKGGGNGDAGMFGVIRGLSGDKYGTLDKVENMMVHTALLELEMQIAEAEEMKRASG